MAVEPQVIPLENVNYWMTERGMTKIILYRATGYDGTFASVDEEALVADKTRYEISDSNAGVNDWYKFRLADGGVSPTYSDYSDPWPAFGQPYSTALRLVRRVAQELGMYGRPRGEYGEEGPSGTTTSNGAADGTTVVCSKFSDAYWNTNGSTTSQEFTDWSLYIASGACAGQQRSVSSLATSGGTFTVSRAFSARIDSGVEFDLFGRADVGEYLKALNDRLKDIWIDFRFPIAGDTASDRRTVYQLPSFVFRREQVLSISRVQHGTYGAGATYYPGVHFDVVPDGAGGYRIYTGFPIAENAVYIVEGKRNPARFAALTDALVIAEPQRDALVLAAAEKLARDWARTIGGTLEDRVAWAGRAKDLNAQVDAAIRDANPWTSIANPWRQSFIPVGGAGFSGYNNDPALWRSGGA